ncbi:MAG: hypothetical protein OXR68_08050 [Alphaproteobacteria bacterium]|nr:hypothetical protein [Alphaproteobacteria bacterium]MDD9920557.1 hypothetical protein [Alphaproteobacteria bacterium]
MDIKVNGPKGLQDTKKSKKTQKSTNVDGPSFSSLLESASETTETAAPQSTAPVTGIVNNADQFNQQDIPQEPEAHGTYLLEQLEELEKDILLGSPTAAVEKLKKALELSPLDTAKLTDKQREILDALHLRAAVELAKME